MEVAGWAVRQAWGGRSLGRSLLVLGMMVVAYQAFKRWRRRHALRKLRGKVVLITGASSGLGEALARLFYSLGAKVILASRDQQKLQTLKFQLDQSHSRKDADDCTRYSPKTVVLDLSSPSSLSEKAREVVQAFGRVDILINNAGVSSRGAVLDTELEVDRRVMETNFFGTISLTRDSASKHALHGYFDSLRCELAPRGIGVSTICPGYINTQLSLNALSADGSKHGVTDSTTAAGMSPEYAAEQIAQFIAEGGRSLILATPTHQLALYLSFFWPSLLDWIIQRRAKIT